jgi:hypothetical protein
MSSRAPLPPHNKTLLLNTQMPLMAKARAEGARKGRKRKTKAATSASPRMLENSDEWAITLPKLHP